DLPTVPAQVQVRARLPYPRGAEHQPALRYRGAPGARALPRDRRRIAGAADAAVRRRLAPGRLRRLERRTPVPRAGGRRPAALLGARSRAGGRAGLIRAELLVPARAAPAARPRGPRRSPSRRELRADRLQDRQGQDRARAARGRAAVAVPDGRPRGLGDRYSRAELLLRARQPQGAGRALGGGARAGARHGRRDRRRDPGPPLRAEAVVRALLLLRLPDRVPGGREVAAAGAPARQPSPAGRNARNVRGKSFDDPHLALTQ